MGERAGFPQEGWAFNKLIGNLGSIPDIRSPADTKAFVKNQYETFKKVVAKLKK